MEKNDLITSNPLRVLGIDNKAEEGTQGLGLVMARAGLGKSAILVQIALDSMLRGNRVLHVAIGETLASAPVTGRCPPLSDSLPREARGREDKKWCYSEMCRYQCPEGE